MTDLRFRPPPRRREPSPLREILRAQVGTLILLVIVLAMLGDSFPAGSTLRTLA